MMNLIPGVDYGRFSERRCWFIRPWRFQFELQLDQFDIGLGVTAHHGWSLCVCLGFVLISIDSRPEKLLLRDDEAWRLYEASEKAARQLAVYANQWKGQ